uniref:Dehydrogenase/reductase SDR family member 11 n=1 Tax=Poecilia reticulata TaxID=8081 RepID=A0A3P9NU22_POERE
MDRWKGRVALVTGASVGIGATIAKELVRYGMTVVGCARSLDKIQALAVECKNAGHSGVLIPMECDLSNAEDIQSMFAAIKAQHKGVDVCINNAGLAHNEPLLSGKTSAWKSMLDVRTHCASAASEAHQSMKEQNIDEGHIINLNSICGHIVVNSSIFYFLTAIKYAVTALTEGVRQELREDKTHIRSISPGLVETEFAYRLHSEIPDKATATYSHLKAIDIANAVVYVLSAPPHVQKSPVCSVMRQLHLLKFKFTSQRETWLQSLF